MKYALNGKTALITGASRGLGMQIAQQFWDCGANLILVARSEANLISLRDKLSFSNTTQTIQIFSADLAQANSIENLITQLKNLKIDILINNAAIQGPIGPVWENDWNEWQSTIQVDLLTPIALCRAIIPNLIKQRYGKIINLSGGGATASRPNFSAYAVAKAGLVRFSETLADEVKTFNIDVNCIAPGVMNTDMLKQIVAAGADKVGQKEHTQIKEKTNDDDSVILRAAELCAYLASTNSDGITGKLISAVWDPWFKLTDYLNELQNSDIYTLRRIVPKDRGKEWSDIQ